MPKVYNMKKEETNINSRKHSATVQRASRSLYLMPHTLYLNFIFYILYLILGSSCHYPRPDLEDGKLGAKTRDSLAYLYERHYTWNTNLEVQEDSVTIACLPVKDCYNTLYKGDRVVVAEFAIHPTDSVDSVWVKLAHSQEVQGWLREKDMIRAFVPTDSISQAIYLFSDTHASYFIVIFALFVAAWLFRAFRRKQLQMVYFNDIDSVYPLLLCLLLAFSATVYESMQVFVPETWQHFYFNPTLSPFKVPFVLSVFLMSLLAVCHRTAGGARRFVPPTESGSGCVLSVGAGFLLHFLLFLLYTDYPYIHRLSVYSRICVGVLQETAFVTGGISLSLRQLRTENRGERGLPALRGNQRIGYLPVSAGGTSHSKGRYLGYRQLVLRVPTLGSPRTIVWYFTYQCLVAPVPTVGISCTKAGYYFGTRNRFILRGLQS